MARQEINLGVLPNGLGGDTPRVANTKINDMTEELYRLTGDKVDKVAGKWLSSNDYTMPEKTKLAALIDARNYGIGAAAPQSTNIYQIKQGGITSWNQETAGRPPAAGSGQLLSMAGGSNGEFSSFIATSFAEDRVWFSRINGTERSAWRQFVLVGDYGYGSDPRLDAAADQIGYIPDISVVRPNGKFRVSPATVGGPGVYGTLDMNWYDATNWTMVVQATDASVLAVKGCVNGTATGWAMHYPGRPVLTRIYESLPLSFTNGQLQAVSHNFGAEPKLMQLIAIPIVDQASWSANLHVHPLSGFSIGAGAGQIFIKIAAAGLTVLDAHSGNVSNLIPANWRILVRAFI